MFVNNLRLEAIRERDALFAENLGSSAQLLREAVPNRLELSNLLSIQALRSRVSVGTDRALRSGAILQRKILFERTLTAPVYEVALSPDGRFVAAKPTYGEPTGVWDIATGAQLAKCCVS